MFSLQLLFIPLTFAGLFGYFTLAMKFSNFLERRSFLKSIKKRNNRWTTLDSKLPILDQERKKIDGPHYQEKPFLIVYGEWWNGAPYPYKTMEMTINDKSILRWVCRYLLRRATIVKAYTSDQVCGRVVYDRSHAKRYINS